MTGFEWLVVIFLTLMTVGMWSTVPSYWAGRNAHLQNDAYRGLIIFTRPAQRAIYRAHLVGVVTLSAFVAGIILLLMINHAGDVSTWLASLALIATFGGVILACCGILSVAILNRPSKFVAPHLRNQPGLLTLWRRAHRVRRSMR